MVPTSLANIKGVLQTSYTADGHMDPHHDVLPPPPHHHHHHHHHHQIFELNDLFCLQRDKYNNQLLKI
jgi:hypothetical protein